MNRVEYKTYLKVLASFDWKLISIKFKSNNDKSRNFKAKFYQSLIDDFIDEVSSYDFQQMAELTDLLDTLMSSAINLGIYGLVFAKQDYKLIIGTKNAMLKQKGKIIGQIANAEIQKLDTNFLKQNKNQSKENDPYLLSGNISDVPFFLISSDKDAKQFVKQYGLSKFFNPDKHIGSFTDILNPFKSKQYQDLSDYGFNLLASQALAKFTYNKDLDTVSHDLINKFYYKAYMPKHKDPNWDTYTRVSWDDGTLSDPELLYTINQERLQKWLKNNNFSYDYFESYQNLLDSIGKLNSEDKILDLFVTTRSQR